VLSCQSGDEVSSLARVYVSAFEAVVLLPADSSVMHRESRLAGCGNSAVVSRFGVARSGWARPSCRRFSIGACGSCPPVTPVER
jgi:hypothetical protein